MNTTVALLVDRETFPLVDCPSCGGRSLTWLDVSGDDDVRRCLACNAAVAGPLVAGGSRAVESLGYVFIDRAKDALARKGLSGCGTKGVKSCGSGGCSSGGCSTGGGGGCGGGCSAKG